MLDFKKIPLIVNAPHNTCHQTSDDCNYQCLGVVRVGPVDDVEGVAFAEEVLLVQRLGGQVLGGKYLDGDCSNKILKLI